MRTEGSQMKLSLTGIPFMYQYVLKTDPIEYYDPKRLCNIAHC